MLTALLLSGQPRGLPICLELINQALIIPNGITDIFMHAWHDESKVGQPYNSAQPSQNGGRCGFVKANTEKMLLEKLNPKKFMIESQKEFPHLRNLKSDPTANQELLGSSFYSTFMANELKKEYEKEKGFTYDCVIRTRYDLFYYHPIVVAEYKDHLDKIMVMEKFQNDQDMKNNPNKPMVDIFSFSSSKNMDVFCGVYPNMEKLNKEIDPPFGENFLSMQVRIHNKIELHKIPINIQILHRVIDLSKV